MRIGLLYPNPDPISPTNWSGTPRGLATGLGELGIEVVPIGHLLPPIIRQSVSAASYLGGRRGAVAERAPVRHHSRKWSLRRALRDAAPLDGLLAMGTELYDLAAIRAPGVPVATYDDGTLQQMWGYPESDIRRSGFPEREVLRWFDVQARSSRAADVCCVSTNFAARSFVDDYGVAPDRVRVVGMGHRPRRHSTGGTRDWSSPKFLFVGVDWQRKNGDAVVRAFDEVRRSVPSATLDIVGRHPPIELAGVTGHGFLAREDAADQATLDRLFATATAFVLPSRFDPSPIAYLEAASAGLPVIATSEGGAHELLGPAAITVHPDDDAALLDAMMQLADPQRAATMGAEAARRAAESSWMHVASRVIESLDLEVPRP